MAIGTGLADWIQAHQATPLSTEEVYPWPDVKISVLPIEIGNSAGQKVRTVIGWDGAANAILGPGPGVISAPPQPLPGPVTMYDSTTAGDIPADAQLVAGYVDGLYAWSEADKARFPTFVSISATGGGVADVCDCETGDLTPDQAAGWVQAYPGNGVYCNRSTAPAVVAAMNAIGMPSSQYWLWIADWTGQPHMVDVPGARVLAVQYADPVTSGGHFDLSLVTPEFLARF